MDPVAAFLRRERDRLVAMWEDETRRDLPPLQSLSRPVLLDHLYELIDALAAWIEGCQAEAVRGFEALIEGHALQRLGYGVGLETLFREYGKLRHVLLRELLSVDVPRESLILMHDGLDRAVGAAIDRYTARREEVRSRFISILGHDLRDPLATITISAHVLAQTASPEQDRVLQRVLRASDRMQRMIGELLDFARGHLGGGIPVNPALSDLGVIAREVVDEIAAARPGREVRLQTQGDLRGAFDRDRAAQTLANLLANGLDHGTGPVEVIVREADDKAHVITSIVSHGAPIPAELLPRIFDPFARGDRSSSRGLGLGLYIVQQIALAHGATCDVSSDAAATTFTITWPRATGETRRAAARG